ncbi:MAG: hypothetical protein VB050_10665 [Geobacteraceae bacterium]|nr:hypothetical protein [Geobacteraceae bacterium]
MKLILITGQRPGEVCGLHKREIDGQWWSIPLERIKTREKQDWLTKWSEHLEKLIVDK